MRLAAIRVYPIKSLPGHCVSQCRILANGALEHDRCFALTDEVGAIVNSKRLAVLQKLRAEYDTQILRVWLGDAIRPRAETFQLDQESGKLEDWLSHFLECRIQIIQEVAGGFPDDTEFPGPTIVSTASLEMVASWFPELTIEEVRDRFRANLEIEGVPAFWEDRLFATDPEPVQLKLGDVQWVGTNPCQRCAVPARWSASGVTQSKFVSTFVAQRESQLPTWTDPGRFDHFYRLGVNTRIVHGEGSIIRVGDPIQLVGSKRSS